MRGRRRAHAQPDGGEAGRGAGGNRNGLSAQLLVVVGTGLSTGSFARERAEIRVENMDKSCKG